MASYSKTEYERLQIFQRPQCLINKADDGRFKIEEETIQQLRQINEPLVVIAITGQNLTGKSVLLNMAAGHEDFSQGFSVSHGSSGTTKGIWALCRTTLRNQVHLFLDTEGLRNDEKDGEDHGCKIVALLTLLSNVFLYNVMFTNSENATKATCLFDLKKYVCIDDPRTSVLQTFCSFLPTFVLCIRDFEKTHTSTTTDENLERCLMLKSDSFGELKRYFPRRKCFTFDKIANRRIMREPASLTTTKNFSKTFCMDVKELQSFVNKCKPKVLLNGDTVRGISFARLVVSCLEDVNSGRVIYVRNTLSMVTGLEKDYISKHHTDELNRKFREIASHTETAGSKDISKEYAQKQCSTELQILFDNTVGEKKKNKEYEKHHEGYYKYKADMATLKRDYRRKMSDVDTSIVLHALHEFLEYENDYETLLASQLNCQRGEPTGNHRMLRNVSRGKETLTPITYGNRQNEQPTEKDLSQIASSIGSEYRHLGFELGIEKAKLDQICLDHTVTVDKTTAILCEWKRRNGNKATFGELHKALTEVGASTENIFRKIMRN